MDQETNEIEQPKPEYGVGDLLWAKIGNNPFWPCMVSYDPFEGHYYKKRKSRVGHVIIYHVQFFGKKVERGWTSSGSIMLYEGKDAFLENISKTPQAAKRSSSRKKINSRFAVSSAHETAWNLAIQEADEARKLYVQERYANCVFEYNINDLQVSASNNDSTVKDESKEDSNNTKKSIEVYGSDKRCTFCGKGNVDLMCSGRCFQYFHKDCLGMINAPENFECMDCDKADACVEEIADGIVKNIRTPSKLSFDWRIRKFSSKMYTDLDCLTSPAIEFLNMSWRLKISITNPARRHYHKAMGWMSFDVWKSDCNRERPVYVTLGIRKRDSVEDVIFYNQELAGNRPYWHTSKFMLLSEVRRRRFYIAVEDVFTITCTLCIYDAFLPRTLTQYGADPHGIVRERVCNSHKEVEWDFDDSYDKVTSPVFTMGSQTYWMEWFCESISECGDVLHLNLYRLGPPIGLSQPTIWWAGMKNRKGKCVFSNTSGALNMSPYKMPYTRWYGEDPWRRNYIQRSLFRYKSSDIHKSFRPPIYFIRDITVYLRFKVERTSKSEEKCSHSVVEGSSEEEEEEEEWSEEEEEEWSDEDPEGEGKVQYIPCKYHVQAEWFIDGSILFAYENYVRTVHSPVISCMDEKFKFELRAIPPEQENFRLENAKEYALLVYSRRLSTCDPYREGRWWVALKWYDGTYEVMNMRGSLDAEDEYNMWTIRGSMELDDCDCIDKDMTVVFRYTVKDLPRDPDFSCMHSGPVQMRPHSAGSVQETKFPLYMQVEWSVDYRKMKDDEGLMTHGTVISPEFAMGAQRYVLQLRRDREDAKTILLYLHRMGEAETPPPRYVQWWAGLRRGDGTYYHKNRRGKLDLEEDCEIWRETFVLKVARDEVERVPLRTPDNLLRIFLRLSEDRTLHLDAEECNLLLPEPKRQRTDCEDEVIFSVKNKEFKMSRNILRYRVPVLEAMFQYDTVEKRTGIANIEDSEPAVFEEFLHYICYGFIKKPNEYNAINGYVLADKYLLEDLKIESLQVIGDNISVHNFCDVFSLSVTFEEDDLLKLAIDFFSKNYKIIRQTDDWSQYLRNNRTTAQKLISLMSPSQQNLRDNLYKLFSSKIPK